MDKGDEFMKMRMKRFWLIAMCVAALTIVSAIPASADVSRVVYFKIQDNTTCGPNHYTSYFLSVSNISSSSADVKIQLFNSNGDEVNDTAVTGNGYRTDITPGVSFTIDGTKSKYFTINYGSIYSPCADRPAWGRVIVETSSGQILAQGEVRSILTSNGSWNNNSDIIINGGQPF